MPTYTQKEIKRIFLKLLDENPTSKMSVTDITRRCGINRNTFYYYYSSIDALVDEILSEKTKKIVESNPTPQNIIEALRILIDFSLNNKSLLIYTYNCVNREVFEKNIWSMADVTVRNYFESVFEGKNVDPADKMAIISFYKCESFAQIIFWVDAGMSELQRNTFERMFAMMQGNCERSLEKIFNKQ